MLPNAHAGINRINNYIFFLYKSCNVDIVKNETIKIEFHIIELY
jgi:hypothetical protein